MGALSTFCPKIFITHIPDRGNHAEAEGLVRRNWAFVEIGVQTRRRHWPSTYGGGTQGCKSFPVSCSVTSRWPLEIAISGYPHPRKEPTWTRPC